MRRVSNVRQLCVYQIQGYQLDTRFPGGQKEKHGKPWEMKRRGETTGGRQTALVENQSCSSINWWCWVPYARPYGAEPLRRAVIDSLQPLTQPGTFTNKGQTINIRPERNREREGAVKVVQFVDFFFFFPILIICLFLACLSFWIFQCA